MKTRLDQLLVARGLAASRTVAQALILAFLPQRRLVVVILLLQGLIVEFLGIAKGLVNGLLCLLYIMTV